jgi:alkyl sulfatase BDS1-like metallo-beta-lactamase superfamily hydrolase
VKTAPDSFAADDGPVVTGPRGQRVHRLALEQGRLHERRLFRCGRYAWCMVGNGLSNQSFVQAPEGLIAIDTGESVEEMAAALRELRLVTREPVVAVIYTHFHYVNGTMALADDVGSRWPHVPVWAHSGVAANRLRVVSEVAPAAERGAAHQLGTLLPAEGDDALVHVGLGPRWRNPEHAPFTAGHVPATHTFEVPTQARIAGLAVQLVPAPSDSDDSITIWFPALSLCINNLMWPCLFNVFPIRGEPYRDPRVLVDGVDRMRCLPIEHLLCTHGPPLAGRREIADALTLYRDSLQFMWDQTVRAMNRGLTASEIAHEVRLPLVYAGSRFTRQTYGLVEHHVRQIRAGLVGWFDGDEAALFPLPTAERAARLIRGFGGRAVVRAQARQAIDEGDLRWALELGSWLVRAEPNASAGSCEAVDRALLAEALRCTARRTTGANVRNWCLTRALELEDRISLRPLRRHRFRSSDVLAQPACAFVPVLRVLLVPERAADIDDELAWCFDDGSTIGLAVRHSVAVLSDGKQASLRLHLSHRTWALMLSAKLTLTQALAEGGARIDGSPSRVRRLLACFDHVSFQE